MLLYLYFIVFLLTNQFYCALLRYFLFNDHNFHLVYKNLFFLIKGVYPLQNEQLKEIYLLLFLANYLN